jgi:YidC/Oxa1 family membrane protein insertase
MNMERRVLFAIFLCFLVLYIWQALFVKPVTPPAGSAAPSSTTATATPPKSSDAAPPATSLPSPAASEPPAPGPTSPAAATIVGETSEREIRVETQHVIAVFTNRGARLKSWRLKSYRDARGQPQELIESRAVGQPLPFTLRTADDKVTGTLNDALYLASEPAAAGSPLRFEFRDAAGIHAVKEFSLDPSSYVVTFRSEVTRGDQPVAAAIVWGPAVGDDLLPSALVQGAQAIVFESGSPVRLPRDDIAEKPVYEGDFRFAGVDDNYFMTAALDTGAARITYQPVSIPDPSSPDTPPRDLLSFAIERNDASAPMKFFVGPKELDVLTAIDREFASAINFGRFAVIVVPLLQSLKWVYRSVGNWGWSIVILTVIINLVLAPLRHKQVVSMRKMQEIQPEVKAIQDRYAKLKVTDPAKQKMNQEMMALYREKKVNPAAGCIPALLTLPIMLAMWAVLQVSIELRGAPWLGWIHDLSAPDPYYVLPVLMVATQFWQQHITPMAGADPAQQKMMKFMPVIMGFLFFKLPAGALLYYVVTNMFGVGQQYVTTRLIGPPVVRVVRPPAERRIRKKDIGG